MIEMRQQFHQQLYIYIYWRREVYVDLSVITMKVVCTSILSMARRPINKNEIETNNCQGYSFVKK